MDKYQQAVLGYIFGSSYAEKTVYKNIKSKKSGEVCGEINLSNGVTVNQEKDITSTVYSGYIPAFYDYKLAFKSAFITENGNEWKEVPVSERFEYGGSYDYKKLAAYKFTFDFENRIKKIKLCFASGLADDLILNVTYNEADKEAYYKEQEYAKRKALIDGANLEYKGCANVIAVYFTPTNESYASAEMDLYWGEDKFMATYKSVPQNFSLMAMGLRHGDYNFVFRQKDESGKIIFETDKIPITVSDSSVRKTYLPSRLPPV